jgi:hypothetical protein
MVYPPVPDEILREDDVVLALVDRFAETVFMSGPGYDALRERYPQRAIEIRSLAREIGDGLPEWLGAPREQFGHSVWDAHADHFVNFSLGPVLANAFLLEQAAGLQPDRVLAWELDREPGWWSGRHMVGEAAQALAEACGCPVELSAPAHKRAVRDTTLPAIRCIQALREFARMRSLDLPRPTGPTDVLFLVPGPTLVPMLDRIGARLQSAHGLCVTAIDAPLGGPHRTIDPGELPRSSLYGFADGSMAAGGMLAAMAAADQFGETRRWLQDWERARDLPRPLQEVLERRLHSTAVAELPVARFRAQLWRRALDALQPRVLVSFNTYNAELAPGVLQARHRGIPTVCLQHGIWGPLFRTAALLPHDELILFGDYAQEMLSPLAAEHTRFTHTGHSMYDDVEASADGTEVRDQLIGDHRHLVLATTQPVEDRLMAGEDRWWLRGLGEACANLDAILVIKPHPHEPPELLELYETLSNQMPQSVRLVRHGTIPLKELIAASDLLVTRFSTTAFEAALLGKPVMTVNLSGGLDQYPFAAEGCAVGVYEYDRIEPELTAILHSARDREDVLAGHQRFLRRHLGPRDGRATERIAERIARCAE